MLTSPLKLKRKENTFKITEAEKPSQREQNYGLTLNKNYLLPEVCQFLRIPPKTARRLIRVGELQGAFYCRAWHVNGYELRRFYASCIKIPENN